MNTLETFEVHYESMCQTIQNRMPGADMEIIRKAVDYARNKHKEQTRKDGSPYIIHPLAVAEIVVEMGLDTDAILGAEIEIPTLEGKMKFTIPEGTQPGTEFVVKQKGIPYVNSSSRRGDLIFSVNVEIPRGLNEKQKGKLREFAESCGNNNYTKKTGFFKKIFDTKK